MRSSPVTPARGAWVIFCGEKLRERAHVLPPRAGAVRWNIPGKEFGTTTDCIDQGVRVALNLGSWPTLQHTATPCAGEIHCFYHHHNSRLCTSVIPTENWSVIPSKPPRLTRLVIPSGAKRSRGTCGSTRQETSCATTSGHDLSLPPCHPERSRGTCGLTRQEPSSAATLSPPE